MFFTWCGIGPLKVRIPRISEVFMALTFSRGAEVFWCGVTGWRRKFIQAERTMHSQPALISALTLVAGTSGNPLQASVPHFPPLANVQLV